MNSLLLRIISAVIAAGIFIALWLFEGSWALKLFATVVIVGGLFEFTKMSYANLPRCKPLRIWFFICGLATMALTLYLEAINLAVFAGVSSFYFSVSIWLTREEASNEELWKANSVAGFGLLHSALFPALAVKLLDLENGKIWFLTLLLVVFAGDTLAYFGGRAMGEKKLRPQLSPNKTMAGAYVGALGSAVAMAAMGHFFLALPLWIGLSFGFFAAFLAQSGDLLVSLIKRVAGFKDSGSLLPGHGGILDRLDGVYLAAPLFFWLAEFFSKS